MSQQPHRREAVIVAGGFGTRMLPLTERRPKHLLEVGGVAFLEHQVSRLADAGVEHVVLATSYRAELFEPVLGDGSKWGLRLTYVEEAEPLGTAGAIRNVAGALGDDPDGAVVILNGDILSDHDLRAQLSDFERPRGGRPVDVSLHLVTVADPRAFGCVPTDADGRVTAFLEKTEAPVTDQINAGCYLFRRGVIDRIPAGRVVSVERETFPELLAAGALVVGYVEDSYWRDVGNPGSLAGASRDLVLGRAHSPAYTRPPGEALVAVDACLGAGARVAGGSTVLAGAEVGADAVVTGSVVMPGARIGARAVVTDSVVGPGAVVGEDARLEGVAVGDEAEVRAGSRLGPDSRVGCGVRTPAR